jgi:hypothetical protein
MKSDPYPNLPVMAPPTCGVTMAVGDGAEIVAIGEDVCSDGVGVGVDVGVELTGDAGARITYNAITTASATSASVTAAIPTFRRAKSRSYAPWSGIARPNGRGTCVRDVNDGGSAR